MFAAKYSGNWAFGVNLPYRHLRPIALVLDQLDNDKQK
jgi:hypothetical protein